MFYNYFPYGLNSRVGFILNCIHKWNLSVVLKFISRWITICNLNLLKNINVQRTKMKNMNISSELDYGCANEPRTSKTKQARINTN